MYIRKDSEDMQSIYHKDGIQEKLSHLEISLLSQGTLIRREHYQELCVFCPMQLWQGIQGQLLIKVHPIQDLKATQCKGLLLK